MDVEGLQYYQMTTTIQGAGLTIPFFFSVITVFIRISKVWKNVKMYVLDHSLQVATKAMSTLSSTGDHKSLIIDDNSKRNRDRDAKKRKTQKGVSLTQL